MPYGRDVGYTRDQLLRDITLLLHECADYNHIYGDNDYWSLLNGPYYEFFEEGESPEDVTYFRSLHPNAPVKDEEAQGTTTYANEENLFLQAGSVLLFFSMLTDWEQGSGYAFGIHGGVCRHPLPLYVQRLVRAYRRVRSTPEHPTRPLYFATLQFLGLLDNARHRDRAGRTDLEAMLEDAELLKDVRALVAKDGLSVTRAQFIEVERAIYNRYVQGYFAERASWEAFRPYSG